VALYSDERAQPGRPRLVGFGRRAPGDGECGRGLGERDAPQAHRAARAASLVGGYRGGTRPTAPPPIAAPGLVVVPGLSDDHRRPIPAEAIHLRALAGAPRWGLGSCLTSEHFRIPSGIKKPTPKREGLGGPFRGVIGPCAPCGGGMHTRAKASVEHPGRPCRPGHFPTQGADQAVHLRRGHDGVHGRDLGHLMPLRLGIFFPPQMLTAAT
jgi:hypothetical protein